MAYIGRSVALLLLLGGSLVGRSTAAPLVLQDGRIEVRATWTTPAGDTGPGVPVRLGEDSGWFWFFVPGNVELVVKSLDACNGFGRFWIFAAGLTNVGVHLEVRDTWTGHSRVYDNPPGRAFAPIQDTDFPICGTPRPCGQGTPEQIAATPRANLEAEQIALLVGGDLVASDADYARVVADLASIRAARPELSQYYYMPNHAPQDLTITLDHDTWAAMLHGDYHAWDCANAWYGVTPEVFDQFAVGVLHLRGVYDLERVRSDFRRLPGIVAVNLDGAGIFVDPPPPVRALCALPRGATTYYFFRDTGQREPEREWTSTPGHVPIEVPNVDTALRQLCEQTYLGL